MIHNPKERGFNHIQTFGTVLWFPTLTEKKHIADYAIAFIVREES
jgi:hypothetical protein